MEYPKLDSRDKPEYVFDTVAWSDEGLDLARKLSTRTHYTEDFWRSAIPAMILTCMGCDDYVNDIYSNHGDDVFTREET